MNSPSSDLPGKTLLLQRKLSSGDCAMWRTVLRFTPRWRPAVLLLVALAQRIDCAVTWRVCRDCAPGADQTQPQTETLRERLRELRD